LQSHYRTISGTGQPLAVPSSRSYGRPQSLTAAGPEFVIWGAVRLALPSAPRVGGDVPTWGPRSRNPPTALVVLLRTAQEPNRYGGSGHGGNTRVLRESDHLR